MKTRLGGLHSARIAMVSVDFQEIEELQHKIAAEHGYELVDHELVLFVRKKG